MTLDTLTQLTWKDIRLIYLAAERLLQENNATIARFPSEEDYYQEVLDSVEMQVRREQHPFLPCGKKREL